MVDKVKKIPIKDVAKDYGINLELKNGRLWGQLPGQNTMAFCINPKTNQWHDFSTGEGGTVVDLAAKMEKIPVNDAVFSLAKRYNIAYDMKLSHSDEPKTWTLKDSQYRKMGIDPTRVTKNLNISFENHSAEQLSQWEKKFNMTMQDLAKSSPAQHDKLVAKVGVETIMKHRDEYHKLMNQGDKKQAAVLISKVNQVVDTLNKALPGNPQFEELRLKLTLMNRIDRFLKRVDAFIDSVKTAVEPISNMMVKGLGKVGAGLESVGQSMQVGDKQPAQAERTAPSPSASVGEPVNKVSSLLKEFNQLSQTKEFGEQKHILSMLHRYDTTRASDLPDKSAALEKIENHFKENNYFGHQNKESMIAANNKFVDDILERFSPLKNVVENHLVHKESYASVRTEMVNRYNGIGEGKLVNTFSNDSIMALKRLDEQFNHLSDSKETVPLKTFEKMYKDMGEGTPKDFSLLEKKLFSDLETMVNSTRQAELTLRNERALEQTQASQLQQPNEIEVVA